MTVSQRHGDGASQHRHHRDQQVRGDQCQVQANSGIFISVMPGARMFQDGDDDVDRAHDRRRAHDVHREDRRRPHGRAHLQRQRRMNRPARSGAPPGMKKDGEHQTRGDQQPEAQVVHPRKGHVARRFAGIIIQFAKPTKAGMMAPNTMIRPCMVVNWLNSSGLKNCKTRLEQLGTDAQGPAAADHQHREREQQVKACRCRRGSSREHPAPPAMRMAVVIVVVVAGPGLSSTALMGGSSVQRLYLRAATTSAGCTTWPVLLDQCSWCT